VFLIAQAPRLAQHREAMRRAMAAALGMDPGCGNVAFATPEGTGALGRQEAIAAHAVAVVERA
jgi:2C-methyl-D-erythritol 2,4-cyclodiphosphate synthase